MVFYPLVDTLLHVYCALQIRRKGLGFRGIFIRALLRRRGFLSYSGPGQRMASAHFTSQACLALDSSERVAYAGIDIATCSVGLLGGLYQMITWRSYLKRHNSYSIAGSGELGRPIAGDVKRLAVSCNPTVILFLALADSLACIGVMAKSIELLMIEQPRLVTDQTGESHREPYQYHYIYVDGPITALGEFAYISSFFWTFCFALDVLFQLRQHRIPVAAYHVLCWGSATVITTLKTILVHWRDKNEVCSLPADRAIANYLAFYLPIVFVMLACPLLFLAALPKIRTLQLGHQRVLTNQQRRVYRAVAGKFFLFVMFFWFCWISNGINGIYVIAHAEKYESPFVFYVFEAMTNPLQGFLNAFIYGRHQEVKGLLTFRRSTDDDERERPIINWRDRTESKIV